jgi:hypothetical protein
MERRTLSIKHLVDYDIRTELVTMEGNSPVKLESAYTKDGQYIGDLKMARFLTTRMIKPEYQDSSSNVCTVGFCDANQKWYGWSHRAICGFKVGDIIKDGSIVEDENVPAGYKIKDMQDARRIACIFAKSVS